MQLHELNDETLAYLLHRRADDAEEKDPRVYSRARLDSATEVIDKITGIPSHTIRYHLSQVYATIGERPSPRTNYYIVWERDAVQALRKRLSENEEVRDA